MNDRVRAPWTLEQVKALNARQRREDMHAYTCEHHPNTPLVPTFMGWVCPERYCDYTQEWALAADAQSG